MNYHKLATNYHKLLEPIIGNCWELLFFETPQGVESQKHSCSYAAKAACRNQSYFFCITFTSPL